MRDDWIGFFWLASERGPMTITITARGTTQRRCMTEVFSIFRGGCRREKTVRDSQRAATVIAQRRRDLGAWWRRKFKCRWRDRRACLIGIAGHNPIAIRQRHFRTRSLEVFSDTPIALLTD